MKVIDFVIKELRQMRRDPRLLMMMFGMPILQLILYGYAVTTDVRHLKTVFCDMDNTSQSRDLIRGIIASPEYFDVVGYVSDQKEAQQFLDTGRASVALIISPTYGKDISRNQPGNVQVLLDGSDPNAGTIASSYLAKIVGQEATNILQQRARSAGL